MFRRYLLLLLVVSVPVVFALSLMLTLAQDTDTSQPPTISDDTRLLIDEVRAATAGYRDLKAAEDAGYGKFLDCFRHGADMGMGQHYVNGDLVGDDQLDPMRPEALVYEPVKDGEPILVAMEYLVFQDQWKQDDPPTLYGQEFVLKTNIPDTPPVWALHIWLYTHNPDGLFADYNSLVSCPDGYPVTEMGMQMAS